MKYTTHLYTPQNILSPTWSFAAPGWGNFESPQNSSRNYRALTFLSRPHSFFLTTGRGPPKNGFTGKDCAIKLILPALWMPKLRPKLVGGLWENAQVLNLSYSWWKKNAPIGMYLHYPIIYRVLYIQGGWFQMFFIFTPNLREAILTSIFFNWVETTNQKPVIRGF